MKLNPSQRQHLLKERRLYVFTVVLQLRNKYLYSNVLAQVASLLDLKVAVFSYLLGEKFLRQSAYHSIIVFANVFEALFVVSN